MKQQKKKADTSLTFSTAYCSMNTVDKRHTTAWIGRELLFYSSQVHRF